MNVGHVHRFSPIVAFFAAVLQLLAGLLQVALFPPLSLGIRFPGNIPSSTRLALTLAAWALCFSGHVT
jgi:hypothetical protein